MFMFLFGRPTAVIIAVGFVVGANAQVNARRCEAKRTIHFQQAQPFFAINCRLDFAFYILTECCEQ